MVLGKETGSTNGANKDDAGAHWQGQSSVNISPRFFKSGATPPKKPPGKPDLRRELNEEDHRLE